MAPVAGYAMSLGTGDTDRKQYSSTERRVPELIPYIHIPVLGSQPAGDVSHKPGGRLPLLFARPVVTPEVSVLGERGTMGVNSLPKTVTRQHRGCGLNPGPSASESSTLTTRLLRNAMLLMKELFEVKPSIVSFALLLNVFCQNYVPPLTIIPLRYRGVY